MSKQEFLVQLRKGLSGFPQDDIEEHVTFYSEMIDDMIAACRRKLANGEY